MKVKLVTPYTGNPERGAGDGGRKEELRKINKGNQTWCESLPKSIKGY